MIVMIAVGIDELFLILGLRARGGGPDRGGQRGGEGARGEEEEGEARKEEGVA